MDPARYFICFKRPTTNPHYSAVTLDEFTKLYMEHKSVQAACLELDIERMDCKEVADQLYTYMRIPPGQSAELRSVLDALLTEPFDAQTHMFKILDGKVSGK